MTPGDALRTLAGVATEAADELLELGDLVDLVIGTFEAAPRGIGTLWVLHRRLGALADMLGDAVMKADTSAAAA